MDDRVTRVALAVRKIVAGHAMSISYPPNLAGMCAIASFTLARALKDEGVSAQIMQGEACGGFGHCWVEVNDEVVDVTATQFAQYNKQLDKELVRFNVADKGKFQYNSMWELGINEAHKLDYWDKPQQPCPGLTRTLLKKVKTLA